MSRLAAVVFAVLLIVIIVALVSGCALQPEQLRPPEERVKTVEVPVPVAVPCFEEKDRPQLPKPTPIDLTTATTDQMAAALAADSIADELYMKQVEALFIKCQKTQGREIK